MTDKEMRSSIEAILFAGGSPVTVKQIATALEEDEDRVREQAECLVNEYDSFDRGITVIRLNDKYQMVSRKIFADCIRKAMDLRRNVPLSQAALEVLAVIAYNQPVTKSFVEQVRGVDCSGVIGSLASKDLIEEKGRLELPGRPLLYGTTDNFLRCFSLSSLDDLPVLPGEGDNVEKELYKEKDTSQLSLFDEEYESGKKTDEKGTESEEGGE